MQLTFIRSEVEQQIVHARRSTKHKVIFDRPETDKPGLWLGGDQGVYLMSNGDPSLREPHEIEAESGSLMAYAEECNPRKLSFNEWRDNKDASYGGSDGTDFISMEEAMNWLEGTTGSFLLMDISEDSFALLTGQTVFLPGSLRRAMEERDYDLRLQKAQVTGIKAGLMVKDMSRHDLIRQIAALHLSGHVTPGFTSRQNTTFLQRGNQLWFHQVPVTDMTEEDLMVMLMTLLEKRDERQTVTAGR